MTGLRIPTATYRLQFNQQFRFSDARLWLPYLEELGITDLYASPLLTARRESPHGYDVIDPVRLNPELGSRADFDSLTGDQQQRGMGLLLDIVPNHMAASLENPWWRDVLRHGKESAYASFFDIDWYPPRRGLTGRVLLPILGGHYGSALENQEFRLVVAEEGFQVYYHETSLPLGLGGSFPIFVALSNDLYRHPLPGNSSSQELNKLLELLKVGAGYREKSKIWQAIWHMYNTSPEVKARFDRTLEVFNGHKGDAASFNALNLVLSRQAYQLAFWRSANEEINYRRFFDVSELVGVRVEQRHVFEATHALILELAAGGQVTGVRVDHIDGLYDPQAYLDRLQKHLGDPRQGGRFYVLAEKILAEGEEIPDTWPVYGTTGYDFINMLNGLTTDRDGNPALDKLYAEAGGCGESFAIVAYNQKKKVITELFASEVRSLTQRLVRLADQDRHGRDLTLTALEQALVELTACLPVYRTYISSNEVTTRDRAFIEGALAEAVRRNPTARDACNFLGRVLLLDFSSGIDAKKRKEWLKFIMSWQQFTGPATAKGIEDTAFYLYNRLISFNEVGGSPLVGISLAEFHRQNGVRLRRWPHTMNATSTHDSKRSEDVRARINVLSEIHGLWSARVERWRVWNAPKKPVVSDREVPGGSMELLIYQTLVGFWPLCEDEVGSSRERLHAYLVKAAREAKLHTSWLNPDEAYEEALSQFTGAILEPTPDNLFLPDFLEFQKITAHFGAVNSLAQVLLKVTSPGVPDFYQGTELWHLRLVDPDNRQPVDFARLARLLAALKEEEAGGRPELLQKLLSSWQDGRIKLYLTWQALLFRRAHPQLFGAGEYLPVQIEGPVGEHVCAFLRRYNREWVLTAVPRLLARLHIGHGEYGEHLQIPAKLLPQEAVWGDSALFLPAESPGKWYNILTGENLEAVSSARGRSLPLKALFRSFPVTLLAGC